MREPFLKRFSPIHSLLQKPYFQINLALDASENDELPSPAKRFRNFVRSLVQQTDSNCGLFYTPRMYII